MPRPRGPNFAMHAELAAQGLSKWQRPRLQNCLPDPPLPIACEACRSCTSEPRSCNTNKGRSQFQRGR